MPRSESRKLRKKANENIICGYKSLNISILKKRTLFGDHFESIVFCNHLVPTFRPKGLYFEIALKILFLNIYPNISTFRVK